jgi:fatty acid synthase
MAGGWDDLSHEGMLGFGDMNATADTDKMLALGLAPDQMSRANDVRRRGFVESQGGGSMLLARGDVALKMGLPVHGVLAYAASFGDGINRSIPAPGIGCLAAALGGAVSPLARALARHGLGADDIALVSKHDTSTQANDPNESGIHQALQQALGRTPGNPLMVVSQKALLGHAKGGAAAWQTIGLCQLLAGGVVPPYKNLESVDPALAAHEHLLYTSETLRPGPAQPLRAGLATSLGFGHVSALLLVVHPAAFAHALQPAERATWQARAAERSAAGTRRWREVMLGRAPLYDKRTERRFAAPDGSPDQRAEETAMLFDAGARLDLARGHFTPGARS